MFLNDVSTIPHLEVGLERNRAGHSTSLHESLAKRVQRFMDNDAEKHDPFALPPPDKLRDIEIRQNERAEEIWAARVQKQASAGLPDEHDKAAALIQRNYRGYRERRALQGHGLDPSTRWLEVCCYGPPAKWDGTARILQLMRDSRH